MGKQGEDGEGVHTNDTRSDEVPSLMLSFASDNYAGVHPEVFAALERANTGHDVSYGDDAETAKLHGMFAEHFGADSEVYPVFNGTGANVIALQAMTPSWGSVICTSAAHVHTDEGGAPEKVAGLKLFTVDAAHGKLTPELIDSEAWGWGDEHRAQPSVVSITQSTELGTVYSRDELGILIDHAHSLGLAVHMDGARIANAAASLNVSLAALSRDVGVDVLSFGGTKNGLMLGEAIVALNPAAAPGLKFLRKTNMQLASKMRFISAQLNALLEGELWLRNAQHANAMAQRLRMGLEREASDGRAPGLGFTQPTEANAVFATLPDGAADELRQFASFYDWDARRREVRWMCSFDTSANDVDAFVSLVSRVLSEQSA